MGNKKTPAVKKAPAVKKVSESSMPGGWYYMLPEQTEALQIKEAAEQAGLNVEYWDAAGVVEIAVGEKCSIDVETDCGGLDDEFSRQFMEENAVKSVFYLSVPRESYAVCEPVLNQLLQKLGGMICGDTDDFSPILR